MERLQVDIPLGNPETREDLTGFQVGYQETKLRHGVDVADKAHLQITESYPDYKGNEADYKEFAGLDDVNRVRYSQAIKNKLFALDENNNIVDGENHFAGALWMFDNAAIKGYLLAERNGYNEEKFDEAYSDITKNESERLAKAKEGMSLMGYIGGTLAGYATEPETLIDFASPGKIIGSTIAKGAGKAFITEGLYAGTAEVLRQKRIKEHMGRAGLEYTLWDATKEILINSGFAGTLRGIGSAIMDWRVVSKINNGITNSTDKEIFERFARRENFKLTQNSAKHLHLMDEVEADIDNGKNVDISAQTDVDINTKTDDAIEAVDFKEELSTSYEAEGHNLDEKAINDIVESPELKDDVYEGMATTEDGDALIKEFADHPDMKADIEELKVLEATTEPIPERFGKIEKVSERAKQVQEAAEPIIGGSEDEAKAAVKKLFKKKIDPDESIKRMSAEDITELERRTKEELLHDKPPEISEKDWLEAVKLFSIGTIITGVAVSQKEEINKVKPAMGGIRG